MFNLGLVVLLMCCLKVSTKVDVQLFDGTVRGSIDKVNDRKVLKFLGIPYAQPPVGALRFERPVPVAPWSGVKEATRFSAECLQRRGNLPLVPWSSQNELETREDCLYLNVWTPQLKPRKPMAVLVWIHGGSFRIGSGSLRQYDGSALAAMHKVVVVTLNYRLGAFGFLYGGRNSSMTGNLGIWDQVEAFRWVNENIRAFGGDPEKVTLFGESVGAVSAGYHVRSTVCRTFFKRFIMMSGVPNWPLPYQGEDDGIRNLMCIANRSKCTELKTVEQAISCIKTLPAATIAESELACFDNHVFTLLPRIEDVVVPQPFSKNMLKEVFKKSKVLLGTNTEEGLIIPYVLQPGAHKQDNCSYNHSMALNLINGFMSQLPEKTRSSIIQHYNRSDVVSMMSSTFGDFLLTCPTQYFAEIFGDRLPVHLYHFGYRGSKSEFPRWVGVTHTMAIEFAFGIPFLYPDQYSHIDRKVSKSLMTSFASFAKTGSPSTTKTTWPLFRNSSQKYVSFTRSGETEIRDGVPNSSGCQFYRSLLAPQ